MAKNITSKDPRKAAIVAALKRVSGGTRVTNVFETPDCNGFMGSCMKRADGRWHGLGSFTVFAIDDEQRAALKEYKAWAGADWKSELTSDWMRGGPRYGVGMRDVEAAFTLLMKMRNTHGPGWLGIFEL